jgi:hypothetical protein
VTGPRDRLLPPIEAYPRWTLAKPGHVLKAFARSTPVGPELVITVDGELLWSHIYRHVDPVTFAAEVDAKRLSYEADGWVAPIRR